MSAQENMQDPQSLMHEIRNQVRQSAGGGFPGGSAGGALPLEGLGDAADSLADLFALTEVDVARDVRTHRPFLGPYVKLRRWVLREIRLTIDPILARQVALNRMLVQVVADQQRRIADLEDRVNGGRGQS